MWNDVFREALGDAVVYTGAGEPGGSELRGGIAFRLEGELQRAVMRRGIEGGDELECSGAFLLDSNRFSGDALGQRSGDDGEFAFVAVEIINGDFHFVGSPGVYGKLRCFDGAIEGWLGLEYA